MPATDKSIRSNKKVSLLQIDCLRRRHTTEANLYVQTNPVYTLAVFFKLLCHSNRLSMNVLKYVNLLSFYSRSLKFGSRHRGPFKRTPSCNAYNWVFY